MIGLIKMYLKKQQLVNMQAGKSLLVESLLSRYKWTAFMIHKKQGQKWFKENNVVTLGQFFFR